MPKSSFFRRHCRQKIVLRIVFFLLLFFFMQLLLVKSFQRPAQESISNLKGPVVTQRPIGVYWKHPRCDCLRLVPKPAVLGVNVKSSCGQFSNLRGLHQKVVSYSFYGDTKSAYFKGISRNAKAVSQLYDGWIVRVYHDIAPDNTKGSADLCDLLCNHTNLDDCYVGDLEQDFKGVSSKFGMLWRFLVMGDPTVDIFAVRDLDSPVYQREVDAVNDWLAANKTWHIMRDNQAHAAVFLGGMWGAKNTDDLLQMQELRREILDKALHAYKSYDQSLLGMIVWPVAKNSLVAHDSFLCDFFQDTRPWPSQRVNMTFVGDMDGIWIMMECPPDCRPRRHKDWTYC